MRGARLVPPFSRRAVLVRLGKCRQRIRFSLAVWLLFISSPCLANQVAIPLEPIRQPSDDLWFEGRVLTSEEAWELSHRLADPIDLAAINPRESEVWRNFFPGNLAGQDDFFLDEETIVQFKGVLISYSGLMRFNVLPVRGENNKFFTVIMQKTLHTMLMRKNLLRKLGYKIPKIKYLKSLKVQFESIGERDRFLKHQIPQNTYGAFTRWTDKELDSLGNQLVIEFKDIAVMMPSEEDHYNVAMGVPPKRLTGRTLRALAIPYALLNVGESINKLSWHVGRQDNQSIILPHFVLADMNTTLDDAKWMLRRLEKLNRRDLEEIVELAHYPPAVAKILVEKIISRRNSLFLLFQLNSPALAFDPKVSFGEELEEGVVLRENWEGYASRFAHGKPDGPFQDFQYFVFSKIRSGVIENLVNLVNGKLRAFKPSDRRLRFHQEQFETGLNHFVDTGEFREFGIGAWASPILSGQLILSRDIVVGSYLGTDNLVQLADTFGIAVDVGVHVGIENVSQAPDLFLRAGVQAVRTYTHLKPVKTLKASFKEPYQNIMVPLVKLQLKKRLDQLANFESEYEEGHSSDRSLEERREAKKEAFEELVRHFNKKLDVGESLLITDRLIPNVGIQGAFNLMKTKVSVGGIKDYALVKRLHVFRKDAETIQVYEDKGRGWGLSFNVGVDHYIPILRFQTRRHSGKYNVKVHTVNINTDLEENPNFYTNAQALYYLFEEGSSELLESLEKPYEVKAKFVDKSSKFAFLVWRAKYLNGDAHIKVKTPQQKESDYLSLSLKSQEGINYQSFVTDVVNYYLGKFWQGLNLGIDPERYKNPAHSIHGVAKTYLARYEARLSNGSGKSKVSHPFINLTVKNEGWSATREKIKGIIKEINKRYGTILFNPQSLDNAQGLRLFDISVKINLYESAIARLASIKDSELKIIQRRYLNERRVDCTSRRTRRVRGPRYFKNCGYLIKAREKNRECQRTFKDKARAQCLLQLAAKLKKDLEFKDFKNLLGEKNLYVYGTINGFQHESEVLNEPIYSHSIGVISGRYRNGPVSALKKVLDIQNGEFHGSWIRETL